MTPSPTAARYGYLPFDRGLKDALATYWDRLAFFSIILASLALVFSIPVLLIHGSTRRGITLTIGVSVASAILLLLFFSTAVVCVSRLRRSLRSGLPVARTASLCL
jgi:uncharacterized membrane protein YhaH (DUF805 family)